MSEDCEERRDRFAVLDPPYGLAPSDALKWLQMSLPGTSFGAVYYPWIRVDDPLRVQGVIRSIPPSGHVAGVYARTDLQRGVQTQHSKQYTMSIIQSMTLTMRN
jgi:phage tail sheath protein FI